MEYTKIVFSGFKGINLVLDDENGIYLSDLLPIFHGGAVDKLPPDTDSISLSPYAADIVNYRFNKFGKLVSRNGQYLIHLAPPFKISRISARLFKGYVLLENYSINDKLNSPAVVFASTSEEFINIDHPYVGKGNFRYAQYMVPIKNMLHTIYYNNSNPNYIAYQLPYIKNFIVTAARYGDGDYDNELMYCMFPSDYIPVNVESYQPLILNGQNILMGRGYDIPQVVYADGYISFIDTFYQDEGSRLYDYICTDKSAIYYDSQSAFMTNHPIRLREPKRDTIPPETVLNDISLDEWVPDNKSSDLWYHWYYHANQYRNKLIISDPINGDKLLVDKYYEDNYPAGSSSNRLFHDFILRHNCKVEFGVNIVEFDYCLGGNEENGSGVVNGLALYKFYLPRKDYIINDTPFVANWTTRLGEKFAKIHVNAYNDYIWKSVLYLYDRVRGDNYVFDAFDRNIPPDRVSSVIHNEIYPLTSWGVMIDSLWKDEPEGDDIPESTNMYSLIKSLVINRDRLYILSDVNDPGQFDDILGRLSLHNPDVPYLFNEKGEILNPDAADVYIWNDYKIRYYPCSGRIRAANKNYSEHETNYAMTRYDRIFGRASSASDKLYLLPSAKNEPEDNVPVTGWYYRFVWDFGDEEFSAPSAPIGVYDILWSAIKDEYFSWTESDFGINKQRRPYSRPYYLDNDDAINTILYTVDGSKHIEIGQPVTIEGESDTVSYATNDGYSPYLGFKYYKVPQILGFNYDLSVDGVTLRPLVYGIYKALYDWFDTDRHQDVIGILSFVVHKSPTVKLQSNLVEYFQLSMSSDLGGDNIELSPVVIARSSVLSIVIQLYKEEGQTESYNALFADPIIYDQNGIDHIGGYYRIAYKRGDSYERYNNNANILTQVHYNRGSNVYQSYNIRTGNPYYSLFAFGNQVIWSGINYTLSMNCPVFLKLDLSENQIISAFADFDEVPVPLQDLSGRLHGMYWPINGTIVDPELWPAPDGFYRLYEYRNGMRPNTFVTDVFRIDYDGQGYPINKPFNYPAYPVFLSEDAHSSLYHDIAELNFGKIEIVDNSNVLVFNTVCVSEDYNNITTYHDESDLQCNSVDPDNPHVWHRTKTIFRLIKNPEENLLNIRNNVPTEVVDRLFLSGIAQLVICDWGDNIAHSATGYVIPKKHFLNVVDAEVDGDGVQLIANHFYYSRECLDYSVIRSIYDIHGYMGGRILPNSVPNFVRRRGEDGNLGTSPDVKNLNDGEWGTMQNWDQSDVLITADSSLFEEFNIQGFANVNDRVHRYEYLVRGNNRNKRYYVDNGAMPLFSRYVFFISSIQQSTGVFSVPNRGAQIAHANYANVNTLRDLYFHKNWKVVVHLPGYRNTIVEQLTSYFPSSLLFNAPRVKIKIPYHRIPPRAKRLMIFRTKSLLANDYNPVEYGLVRIIDLNKRQIHIEAPKLQRDVSDYVWINDSVEFFDDVKDSELDFTYNINDYEGITTPLRSSTNVVVNNKVFYGNIIEEYNPPAPAGMQHSFVSIVPSIYSYNKYRQFRDNALIDFELDAMSDIGISPLIVVAGDPNKRKSEYNFGDSYIWEVDDNVFQNKYGDDLNILMTDPHCTVMYYIATIDQDGILSKFRFAFMNNASIHPKFKQAYDYANTNNLNPKVIIALTNMSCLWSENIKAIVVYRAVVEGNHRSDYYPFIPSNFAIKLVAYEQDNRDGIIMDYGKKIINNKVPNEWTKYRVLVETFRPSVRVSFGNRPIPPPFDYIIPQVEPYRRHYPSTVIYSNPALPNTIRLNNRIDIDEGDGDAIIKMVVAYGNIIVFKEHSVYRITLVPVSNEVGRIDKLTSEYGLIAKNAIYSNGTDIYFLSHQGIMVYDHNRFENIDSYISRDVMSRLRHTIVSTRNPSIRDSSIGFNPLYNEIFVNIPVYPNKPDYYNQFNGTNGNVFVYNIVFKQWTKFQYMSGDRVFVLKNKDRNNQAPIIGNIVPTYERSFARIYCTAPDGKLFSAEVIPKFYFDEQAATRKRFYEYGASTSIYLESPTNLDYDIVLRGISTFYDRLLVHQVGQMVIKERLFDYSHPMELRSDVMREDVIAMWRSHSITFTNKTWLTRLRKIIAHVDSNNYVTIASNYTNLALRSKQKEKHLYVRDGYVVFIPDFVEGEDRGNYIQIEIETRGQSEISTVAFYARPTNTWIR